MTLALSLVSVPVHSQLCLNNSIYLDLEDESSTFPICYGGVLTCEQPELQIVEIALDPQDCDQTFQSCAVTAFVDAKFPGNHQNDPLQVGFGYSSGILLLEELDGNFVDACGLSGAAIVRDIGTFIHSVGVPCYLAKQIPELFQRKLKATMCPCSFDIPFCPWQASCENQVEVILDYVLPTIKCPPKFDCCDPECEECQNVGSGTATKTGDAAGICKAQNGPGARLSYVAGGAGSDNLPGTPSWRPALGRGWSHDYAERLVRDPDDSRVWLITRYGSFREFRDGDHDGFYEYVSPSDEQRELRRTTGGWELSELDGTVHSFDVAGRWRSTLDLHGVGKTASYDASGLTRVDLPDGRHERFTYHPDGKLAAIVEVGVDGTSTRNWSYLWAGDDLVEVLRPDGTRLRYRYEDPRHPGFMTQAVLVATDGSERVETAWQYDHAGRAVRIWKGDVIPGANGPAPGPAAAEVWSMNFTRRDSVGLVIESQITDPLGQVSTYAFGRDSVSAKPRLTRIAGECASCGLGPNSQLFYDDPANPMQPTRVIDARGTTTLMSYNSRGQMTSRTEAAGTAIERTSTWEYHPDFPSLVTALEEPSTSGSGVRRTAWTYDGAGNRILEILEGVENGSAFSYETSNRFNSAGQVLTVDPPGFGTDDRTVFTYDPLRGDQYVATRTDPLIGTTIFNYDAFNRPAVTTDPNGLVTEIAYDPLDRIERITQRGTTPSEDLITTRTYDSFGQLFRTILPEGNVIENGYDELGRLVSIERKLNVSTPGERAFYTLDKIGRRTREELQRWSGSNWVTESSMDFIYGSRCHLSRIEYPDGGSTEFAYDCNGKLEREWDANHPSNGQQNPPSRIYTYDWLDRLTTITQPWGGAGGGTVVTRYGYDVQDNLVEVEDGNGTITSWFYSDRGLVTAEHSEVSGTSTFTYNEHGAMTRETDASQTTIVQIRDPLDRLLHLDYPGDDLDTIYSYDDDAVPFSQGRLVSIARPDSLVSYRYDRFGRTTQDGELTYTYDRNGNRIGISYPGAVSAAYTFDFADRQASLSVQAGAAPAQPIVVAAGYEPLGPLASLVLGNGLQETRSHDRRYFPAAIEVPGQLSWSYTVDAIGNAQQISDDLDPASNRNYSYQDYQYFLTHADGPWGNLAWAYDRAGNRLAETRDGIPITYGYTPNAAGQNSPRLSSTQSDDPGIEPAEYATNALGHQIYQTTPSRKIRLTYDVAKRLSEIRHDSATSSDIVTIDYDGRSLLRRAALRLPSQSVRETRIITATYDSDGLFHHKSFEVPPTPQSPRDSQPVAGDQFLFYFAGRPVGQMTLQNETSELLYLTTDHLGTPILATASDGHTVWHGGFDPFASDDEDAADAGIFARLPGQWTDSVWANASPGMGLYYNAYRWYASTTGQYTRADPLGVDSGRLQLYTYALQNPNSATDPLGLEAKVCCRLLDNFVAGRVGQQRHCYIVADGGTQYSLFPEKGNDKTFGVPRISNGDPREVGGKCQECKCKTTRSDQDRCLRDAFNNYPVGEYKLLGPNSNTFVGTLARKCCVGGVPDGIGSAPGINDEPATDAGRVVFPTRPLTP